MSSNLAWANNQNTIRLDLFNISIPILSINQKIRIMSWECVLVEVCASPTITSTYFFTIVVYVVYWRFFCFCLFQLEGANHSCLSIAVAVNYFILLLCTNIKISLPYFLCIPLILFIYFIYQKAIYFFVRFQTWLINHYG